MVSDVDDGYFSARTLGCEISGNPLDPLEPIMNACKAHHPDEDMDILNRASMPPSAASQASRTSSIRWRWRRSWRT